MNNEDDTGDTNPGKQSGKLPVTLELSEAMLGLLNVLPGGAVGALRELAERAADGIARPGAWEREWLEQVFPEDEWEGELEPDPAAPHRMRPRE